MAVLQNFMGNEVFKTAVSLYLNLLILCFVPPFLFSIQKGMIPPCVLVVSLIPFLVFVVSFCCAGKINPISTM